MEGRLLTYMKRMRGPAHEGHMHYTPDDEVLYNKANVPWVRLGVSYKDLVDQISTMPEHIVSDFDSVEEHTWFRRVRDWCKRNEISIRTPNVTSRPEKEEQKVAQRCLGTIEQVELARKAECLKLEEIANMDETSMRILATCIMATLHWRGARDVPVAKEAQSKLTLSMPVIWFGDGTFEFMVLWSKGSRSKHLRWECRHGVWWLEAPSKFTRKKTYPEILRFFLSRGKHVTKLYVDDMAGGHNDTQAENLLASLDVPCKRIRIQGLCTDKLQPADRPQANKNLKKLVRKHMRKQQIEKTLEQHAKLHKSLTVAARNDISLVLKAVRKEFNESKKYTTGVVNAFKETLWTNPVREKHSGLRKLLNKAKEKKWEPKYEPYGTNPKFLVQCAEGCGFRWQTQTKRKNTLRRGTHTCWFLRPALIPAFKTGQLPDQDHITKEGPVGLMFQADYKGKQLVGVVASDTHAYDITKEQPTLLEEPFWNECTSFRYLQQATNPELYTKSRGMLEKVAELHLSE